MAFPKSIEFSLSQNSIHTYKNAMYIYICYVYIQYVHLYRYTSYITYLFVYIVYAAVSNLSGAASVTKGTKLVNSRKRWVAWYPIPLLEPGALPEEAASCSQHMPWSNGAMIPICLHGYGELRFPCLHSENRPYLSPNGP